jgi:putative transposase
MGLAENEAQRAAIYAGWVKGTIPDGEWRMIRASLQRGQLTGSSRFVDEIEQKIARRVEFRGPGRPAKKSKRDKRGQI